MYEVDWLATTSLLTLIISFMGVVATFVAAIVAWNISEKWRHQKSSEVLANEAKLLITDLFTFNALIEEFKNLLQPTNNEIDQKIQRYKSLISSINDRINFLTFETNGDQQPEGFIKEFRELHTWFFEYFLQPYIANKTSKNAPNNLIYSFILLFENEEKKLANLLLSTNFLARTYRDIALYKPRKKKKE